MKERIKKIIDYKSITPGDLAKITGVQRSNISHILNGRNKPGATFIEKFLKAFPEVNARWLLTGEGIMMLHSDASETEKTKESMKFDDKSFVEYEEKSDLILGKKYIEKVVLLFSDGTFSIFKHN